MRLLLRSLKLQVKGCVVANKPERLKITKDEFDIFGRRILWLHTASRNPISAEKREEWRHHPRVSQVARRKNAHKVIVALFPCSNPTTEERDQVLAELAQML